MNAVFNFYKMEAREKKYISAFPKKSSIPHFENVWMYKILWAVKQ